jgi:hypothetical protein
VAFEVDDLQAVVDELAADGYGQVGGIGEYEHAPSSVMLTAGRTSPQVFAVGSFEEIEYRSTAQQ